MKQKRRKSTAPQKITPPAQPPAIVTPLAVKPPVLLRQHRRAVLFICLVLLAITFLAYGRVAHNGFVNDDDPAIVFENNHIKNGFTADGLHFAFTDISLYYWQPLTWMSHMLDCQLFGLDPRPAHVENVLLHVVNSILVFLLLFTMTGRVWPSGLCSALFALHPLHVESVAWISERRDVLVGCFTFLALLAYVRYTRRPQDPTWRGMVFFLFWLALASKPIAVVIPLLMLVLDHWPLQRLNRATVGTLVREKIPLFLSSGFIAVLTAFGNSGKAIPLDVTPLRLRIAHVFSAYGEYILKFLKPWPLAHFYPYSVPENLAIAAAGFTLVFITGLVLRYLRQKPYLLAGWLWFLIGLFPVIGLMQVGGQSIADRFMYIPLVGLAVIAIWLGSDVITAHRKLAPVAAGVSVAVLAAMGVLVFRQTAFWADGITLYRHTLSVTDRNERMWYFYATALEQAGSTEEAVDAYRQAIRLEPGRGDNHEGLGTLLLRQGRLSAAIPELREVIRLEPDNVSALRNLALALMQTGATNEAAQHIVKARMLAPQDQSVEGIWRLLSATAHAGDDLAAQSQAAAPSEQAEPRKDAKFDVMAGYHALSRDEWLQLGILLGLIGVAAIWPKWGVLFGRLESPIAWLAQRPRHAFAAVALAPLILRLLLLPVYPIPEPMIHDEFGYLLQADTFASGRLANPPHPMKDHFESIYILQNPSYASYYPIGQGLALAVFQVLGLSPWWGVWASIGAMCAALYWMLLGWMPPRWALLGALLAGLRFGVLSHWMNTYWGGAMAAIGGSLVLGSLPRIYRRANVRNALILGCGFGLLSQTRPYEGLLLGIPVGIALLVWLFRPTGAPARRERWIRVALPLAAVLLAAGAFGAYYNMRLTGNPWQLPYQYYAKQYGVPQSFYWQKPLPPQNSGRLPELTAMYQWQLSAYNVHRSVRALASVTLQKLASLWQFYFQPVWTLPLLLALFIFRDRRVRFLVVAALVVLVGVGFYPFFFPHYLAPILGAVVALVVQGIRRIRVWRPNGLPVGRAVASALIAATFFCILIAPAGEHLMPTDRVVQSKTPRERIIGALHRRSGRHLVIVRYGPNHPFHYGLINNEADIDRAEIVWARDLGPEKNQELIRYYPDRTVWSFDADRWPVHIVPYAETERRADTSRAPGEPARPAL